MLFNLQSGGRRRIRKVASAGLALLVLVGLIGLGSGFSGSSDSIGGPLLDPPSVQDGENVTARLTNQVQDADARTKTNATDPDAWAALATARVRLAQVGENFDATANNYTAQGRRQLIAAATAWDTYIGMNPSPPHERLARSMTQVFLALEQPGKAVSAWELIVELEPTANTYTNLALLAYQADQVRKGDRASTQAQELAENADKKQELKEQLEHAKSQAQQIQERAPAPTPTIG
jgi:hypothetical protein